MNVAEWIMLGGLTGLAVYDLKTKKVPVSAVIFLGILVLVYRLCTGVGVLELVAGLIPGLLLLLLAFGTRESIGVGDGMVVCVLGLFCGVPQVIAALGMALVVSAALALVLLLLRRVGRKTELPFLPCLLVGYLLCLLW